MARPNPLNRGAFLDPSKSSPAPSTSSAPPFTTMFPGFLSDEVDYTYNHLAAQSTPSSIKSPALHSLYGQIDDQSKSPGSFPRLAPRQPTSAGPSSPELLSPASTTSSGKMKRRPKPLTLAVDGVVRQDEELASQKEADGIPSALSSAFTVVSASSEESNLSSDMQNLSVLRQNLRRNLRERPIDSIVSPLRDSFSDSDRESINGSDTGDTHSFVGKPIAIEDVISRISTSKTLVIDTRPLGAFLSSHLPGSAHISIPSLMYKRFRKTKGKGASWNTLAGFVSTPSGKQIWEQASRGERSDLTIVVGLSVQDEVANTISEVMEEVAKEVRVLSGGWTAVLNCQEAVSTLVTGEDDSRFDHNRRPAATSAAGMVPAPSLIPPRTAPHNLPVFNHPPPPVPNHQPQPASMLSHQTSMPSLRTGIKRNLPSLSIQPVARRVPKLSLSLDQAPKSAITGSFPDASKLSLDTLNVPPTPGGPSFSGARSPVGGSFQTACHEQSKSPSVSFLTSNGPDHKWSEDNQTGENTRQPLMGGMKTSRVSVAPFIVSTIMPSFLYLGPEITNDEEIAKLKEMGVRRVLNVAMECEDDEGELLKGRFDKYLKIPMRDMIEEVGVNAFMREANEFLDDARLHSAPTYVHCKAGKSRSVTVVLAYLIHANAWSLKTAYAYVSERRKGISPNIGFVAELMQFEESELGLKQSSGIHGETAEGKRQEAAGAVPIGESSKGNNGNVSAKPKPRYARESLPPPWSGSLDSRPPRASTMGDALDGTIPGGDDSEGGSSGRRQVQEEREVRKNGQWVHHRRVPFDRTTLQPGRRVSKAGLESLRPLAVTSQMSNDSSSETSTTVSQAGMSAMTDTETHSTTQSKPEPVASPGAGERDVVTPRIDSRLNWI